MNTGKLVVAIFIFAFLLRVFTIYPYNTIIGFDQARDLFVAKTIVVDHDLKIIGPTAGNNDALHHGVLYWYYLVPGYVLSSGNPAGIAMWNAFFNSFTVVVAYLFVKNITQNNFAGIVAAALASISHYLVQYSGWLSNPSPTLLFIPLVFYSLWKYINGKNWGLLFCAIFLGICIQLELFLLYLIPTILILWLIFSRKLPSLKTAFFSLALFCLATSTMIATEIKYDFSGMKAIFGAGQFVGEHTSLGQRLVNFGERFFETFEQTLLPLPGKGAFLFSLVAIGTIVVLIKHKKLRMPIFFVLGYLFSPILMLILGSHNAPWFLISVPLAAILLLSIILYKLFPKVLLISLGVIIIFTNFMANLKIAKSGQTLLEPDSGAIMAKQLQAIDYTYLSCPSKQVAVDTVTNPLYINSVWAYHFDWYGKTKYGFLPNWLGGKQNYPYDVLPSQTGTEKCFYVIADQTPRIGEAYRQNAINSALEKGKLVETRDFEGIVVYKFSR